MSKDDDLDFEAELLKVTEGSAKKKKAKDSSDEEGQINDSEDDRSHGSSKKPLKKRKVDHYSDSSDDEFNDGYDENLMGDEADRKYLYSLPELDREALLAERYSKRKELQERQQLKKKLRGERDRDRPSSSYSDKNKTKTRSSTGSNNNNELSPRSKKGSRASALSDLKKRRQKARTGYRDDDDGDEEDEDYDNESESPKASDSEEDFVPSRRMDEYESQQAEDRALTREQLNSICLRRDFLEKKVIEPYFDKLVLGFFVRIGIGVNADRKPVYRVAQVVGVKDGAKQYTLGQTHKTTNKLLMLKHASSEPKSFSIEHVSNHGVTDTEFASWMREMEKHHLDLMTSREVETKRKDLQKFLNYTYTAEDVEKMVEQRKKEMPRPINFAVERAALMTKRDAAKDLNEMEEYNNLCKQIEKLDEAEKEHREKVEAQERERRENKPSSADKLKLINQKNKQSNVNAPAYQSMVAFGETDLDPFSRRRTKPSKYVITKGAEGEQATEGPADGTKEAKDKASTEKNGKSLLSSGNNKLGSLNPELLLKQAHDFDLDILPPVQLEARPETSVPIMTTEPTDGVVKKKASLSVNDYKRRRGLL